MNRLDYYFRQKVTEAELDQGFTYCEDADLALVTDFGRVGVASGLGLAEAGTPNLTLQLAAGKAYDKTGRRLSVPSTQSANCAVDFNAISTAVAGGGNEKWISIFLVFARSLSDSRTDGNAATVYFQRAESFSIKVVQGAEAAIGAGVRPTLDGTNILLADVKLVFGTAAITNAMIDTTRREDSIVASGSPRSLRRGKTLDALTDLLGFYNNHVTAAADKHAAADINYAGGSTWGGGAFANPAATMEAALDKVIGDLGTYTGGMKRVVALTQVLAQSLTDSSGAYVDVTNYYVDVTSLLVGDIVLMLARHTHDLNGASNSMFSRIVCTENGGGVIVIGGGEVKTTHVAAASDKQHASTLALRTVGTAGTFRAKIQLKSPGGVNATIDSTFGGNLTVVVFRP